MPLARAFDPNSHLFIAKALVVVRSVWLGYWPRCCRIVARLIVCVYSGFASVAWRDARGFARHCTTRHDDAERTGGYWFDGVMCAV